MRWIFHVVASIVAVGCGQLPDVRYVTERIELATDFDDPVCEGTLEDLDRQVERIEQQLGRTADPRPIRVYWLEDGLDGYCAEGRGGCFYPATRVLFSRGTSLDHELLHAVVDSEGESYFVEEGLAELLSGDGVVHDPRAPDSDPLAAMRLSRSAYRDGGLDYAAAAHFMHYVFRRAGTKAIRQLGLAIEADPTPEKLEEVIERTTERAIETVVDDYRRDAPRYYAGLAHGRVESLELDDLMLGIDVELDPDDSNTRGPWPTEDVGMYRVFQIAMPTAMSVEVFVDSDDDAEVHLFDPHARLGRGRLTDWQRPNPALDPNAVVVYDGTSTVAPIQSRTYLLVVAAEGPDPVDVRVQWVRRAKGRVDAPDDLRAEGPGGDGGPDPAPQRMPRPPQP